MPRRTFAAPTGRMLGDMREDVRLTKFSHGAG
jgi:hypothetical protein